MNTQAASSSRLRPFLPMLFDLFAPIAVYYALHAAGLSDFIALTAGGFVSGANALVDVVRSRKTRSISLLVFVLFGVSIALVFATRDARILLVKPSIFIGAAGLFVLSTAPGRPFLLDGMEPFATRGDPARREKWQHAWIDNTLFRRKLQAATALTGVLLLLEAAARAVIVFSLPVDVSVLASNLPGVLMIVFLALIGRFFLKPAAEAAMGE